MKHWFLILLFSFFLVPFIYAGDFVPIDHTTYFGTTDRSLTVAWDVPENNAEIITGYEIKLYHVEREVDGELIEVPSDTLRQTLTLPRSGHYIVYVRSVNANATDEVNKYSIWADSSDPAHGMVNGERKSWWIYGHIDKPGGVIFLNEGH